MNITFKKHGEPIDYLSGLHVVTYAETGFSPLDIHARKFDLSRDKLDAFVEEVNRSCEAGTLYPAAPISAVPQSCIRDTVNPSNLERHLFEFLDANAKHIHATSLLLDFSTPRLSEHVQRAISKVFARPAIHHLNDLIIIKN